MRFRSVVAGFLLLVAAAGLHAQGARDEALRNMTAEQRENLWRSMTPQQRADFWSRLTPEQRQSIRQQRPPEQREAMRQRMMEERQRRMQQSGPAGPASDAAEPEGPGRAPASGMGPGPRRLSLEERQKLREQIMESARDMRESPRPRMGIERRRNRER